MVVDKLKEFLLAHDESRKEYLELFKFKNDSAKFANHSEGAII